MGPIGIQEMMALVLVALLLFGPKKLPELGRILGKGLSEFRRMKSEFSQTFETHMRELEREARLSDLETSSKSLSAPAPYVPGTSYSYPYEDAHADGAFIPAADTPAEIAAAPILPVAEATTPALEAPHEPPVMSHAVPDTVARSTTNLSNGVNGHHASVHSENDLASGVSEVPEPDEAPRA